MRIRRLAVWISLLILVIAGISTFVEAQEPKKIKIGYFEGGKYPYHSRLRDEFISQLNAILPDSLAAVFSPQAFRSAEWDKKKSEAAAKELAGVKDIELVVAVGPWVIKDLLSAGFNKPIVGIHQFAPQYEGLIDKHGQPKAKNLTVHVRPDKIRNDLTRLKSLMKLEKLGLIYFPSSNEADSVLNRVKAVGEELGIEVVSSSGYDNKGTFAIYNAFNALDKRIDALYMPPMWGLDIQMINQFFYLTDVQKLPVMTSEDKFLVERGALLSNCAYDIYSEARFSAYKAAQIILGATPNELPVAFTGGTAVAINEKTAEKCKIQLNRILYMEAEVIRTEDPAVATPLTLTDAIDRAVAFNPGLMAQKEALNAAAAAASQAQSEYLPHLSLTAGFGYRDDNYVNNSRDELKQNYYASQLNLSQRIFSLETIRDIKIAAKEEEIESSNAVRMQQRLELAVTRAYLNYLKARELLALHKRIKQLVERNLELSGTRYLIENGSEYDHSRWRVERDKSIQAIADAENNHKVAQILLNTLLNYPVNTKLQLPQGAYDINAVSVTYNRLFEYLNNPNRVVFIEQMFADYAVRNNPTIIRSRRQIDLQNFLLKRNKALYFPTFDLVASLNYADEQNDTPPPFKEEKSSWTIGGFVNLPLFLGFDRSREKRKLKADYSRLEYERDKEIIGVKAGVQTSLTDIITNLDKLSVNVRRSDRTKYNLNLVLNGYDSGEYDIKLMTDEVYEVTSSEMEEIATRFGLYEAMADLAFEIGWTAYGSGTTFTQQLETMIFEY